MTKHDQIVEVEAIEKRILKEESRIERSEAKIAAAEAKILKVDRRIESNMPQLAFLRTRMVRKLSRHRFLFTMVITVAIVLIWRGIWEISEGIVFLSSSFVALLAGVFILWFINRYTELP
jgi:hypothetical protein